MMNRHGSVILLVALLLGACGGGGGGSDSTGGGGGNGGGDGGAGDGGGGSGDPIGNSTAEIHFPRSNSSATAPTVTIRGTAADPEGVAGVSINGVAATITATGSASSQTLLAKTGLADGEVEWSAEVELENGENEFVISVEDEGGEVTGDVAAAAVTYIEVPVSFTLDPEGTRLVGVSQTLTPSGYELHLMQHDYDTLEQKIFEVWAYPETSCFRRFENEFLYLLLTDTWELHKFDLTSEQDSLLVEFTNADLDPGAGFGPEPVVTRLVCGDTHTSAYLLVNYTDEDGKGYRPESGYAKSRVVEIELATGFLTTLSETDTTVSPRWLARDIALDENTIVAMEDVNPFAPLTGITLGDNERGTRTDLTPGINVGGDTLDAALAFDRVYVATLEGVDEVDVSAPPGMRSISIVDDNHPLVFSSVRSTAFDPANNRVIVADEDLDALIAVDITTGERSEFLSRKVGTGVAVIAPRSFAISADAARAYVADDGGNAPARLFEVDLANGDRRLIDISQGITQSQFVTGLALDEDGGRVFVSGHDVIVEVDLESEDIQTIATTDSTDLGMVTDLVLDIDNNRLLVGDLVNDAIFALDLTTHAVEIISQQGAKGDGPPFGGIVSLTRVAATPDMYVAGQTSGTVTRVNLETGDREELTTGCDVDDPSAVLDQVLYNESINELIIRGDNYVTSVDLGTATCSTQLLRVFPLQVQITPTNQMLASALRAVMQIDRDTGEVVLISK